MLSCSQQNARHSQIIMRLAVFLLSFQRVNNDYGELRRPRQYVGSRAEAARRPPHLKEDKRAGKKGPPPPHLKETRCAEHRCPPRASHKAKRTRRASFRLVV